MILRIPVQAGITIVRCPAKCGGHMPVAITLKQAAKIRCGQDKAFSPRFTCNHETVEKVIVEAR